MMTQEDFKKAVSKLTLGKKLPDAIYLHSDLVAKLPASLKKTIVSVQAKLPGDYSANVIKLYRYEAKLAFLSYADFETKPFPALVASHLVDLASLSVKKRSYAKSENPPILHRKELLVGAEHPHYTMFSQLTQDCERAELFVEPTRIGFQKAWQALLIQRRLQVVGHQLRTLKES